MSQGTIELADLKRVSLGENDTLMIRLKERVPPSDLRHLQRQLQGAFPDNDVIVLAVDADAFVIKRGEQPAADSGTQSKLHDLTKVAGTA